MTELPARVPPHSAEAECAVLGSILIKNTQWNDVAELIAPRDFYQQAHQQIATTIWEMRTRGMVTDIVTVTEDLRHSGNLEAVGGTDYIIGIASSVPSAANAVAYANAVRETAQQRSLLRLCGEAIESVWDGQPATETQALLVNGLGKAVTGKIYTTCAFTELVEGRKQIAWLWEDWLPRGFITMIAGRSGIGKSALALATVERIIKTSKWPDGNASVGGGKVLWDDTESSEHLLMERLVNWNMDTNSLHVMVGDGTSGEFANPQLDKLSDWLAFVRTVEKLRPDAVIIDSISGAHGKKENSADMRSVISRLADLARDFELAVIVTHHLRKRSKDDPREIDLDRIRGSTVITQWSRVVWAVDVPDPSAPERIGVCQIKNNFAAIPDEFGFQITESGIVFTDAPQKPQQQTDVGLVCDFITEVLQGGPQLAHDVLALTKEAGFSERTYRRARKRLLLMNVHKPGGWMLALPAARADEVDQVLDRAKQGRKDISSIQTPSKQIGEPEHDEVF